LGGAEATLLALKFSWSFSEANLDQKNRGWGGVFQQLNRRLTSVSHFA
jgi:hypothetical protein